MRLVDRLLHRTSVGQASASVEPVVCLHTALLPRWGSVADMGQDDKVTSYHCESCGKDFTRMEAEALRATEAERLRLVNEPPAPT